MMSLSDSDLDELRVAVTLREHRFRSHVPFFGPLIAWFRELWNSVSTKWYVRPLIQQQNEINQQLVAALAALVADLREIALRLQDHDEWLIAQDREQSAAIGDLSDTALRLVQANRRLAEVERRLAALEANAAPPSGGQQP